MSQNKEAIFETKVIWWHEGGKKLLVATLIALTVMGVLWLKPWTLLTSIERPPFEAPSTAKEKAVAFIPTGEKSVEEVATATLAAVETEETAAEKTATPEPTATNAPTHTPRSTRTPRPTTMPLPTATEVVIESVDCVDEFAADFTGELFAIQGVPASVNIGAENPNHINALGFGSWLWTGEPGTRIAVAGEEDPNDGQCGDSESCWYISPDTQNKLTHPDGEGLDLDEGAFTVFVAARISLQLQDNILQVNAKTDHGWIVVTKGLLPGEGDLNLPINAYGYDAGFAVETNFPPGTRISEDAIRQIMAGVYEKLNCGLHGCGELSILFYDANTMATLVLHQAGPDAPIQLVWTNIEGVTP